ncbi:MAG: hypothetical protein U0793_14865 [Gemmataceae bacterium]
MSTLSTFLFAEPSFAEGMARAIDLGGTLNEYNRSPSGELADYFALSADWRAVGCDLQVAADKVSQDVASVKKLSAKEKA